VPSEAITMSSDIREELLKLFPPAPKCPPNASYNSIDDLYHQFLEKLEGTWADDRLGRRVFFRSENFPYLVKLKFFDNKQKMWVDAFAERAIQQLKDKCLDESRYKIGDHSRARTIFWIRDIIEDPDRIHEYDRRRMENTDIYVREYDRAGDVAKIKVVEVVTRECGEKVVRSSFWSDEKWLGKYAKIPPKYQRK
jgi:hypothetical protein